MTLVFHKRKIFEITNPVAQDYNEEDIKEHTHKTPRLQSGEKLNKITRNFTLRTVTSSEELGREAV